MSYMNFEHPRVRITKKFKIESELEFNSDGPADFRTHIFTRENQYLITPESGIILNDKTLYEWIHSDFRYLPTTSFSVKSCVLHFYGVEWFYYTEASKEFYEKEKRNKNRKIFVTLVLIHQSEMMVGENEVNYLSKEFFPTDMVKEVIKILKHDLLVELSLPYIPRVKLFERSKEVAVKSGTEIHPLVTKIYHKKFDPFKII